jgi:hypothetical protein
VEAVLADMELLIVLIRETVHECLLRNGLVECGVEYNDLRHVRQDLAASPQCQCVTVVMYRSQLTEFVDLFDDLIGDQCGLGEYFCTLYHTVANCRDLVHAGNYGAFTGGQCLNQTGKCLGMGREVAVLFHLDTRSGLVAQMAVDTDTVAVALCDHRLIFHIDELILQRRASCIDNKNNHGKFLLFRFCGVCRNTSEKPSPWECAFPICPRSRRLPLTSFFRTPAVSPYIIISFFGKIARGFGKFPGL